MRKIRIQIRLFFWVIYKAQACRFMRRGQSIVLLFTEYSYELLHTKHELKNCNFACEGEVGSKRNQRVWLNRCADRPEEITQPELHSSHGAKILHLAFEGEVGARMDGIGTSG